MIAQFFLLLALSAAFLFWLLLRRTKYWQRHGIPGPASVPIKGNLDSGIFWQRPAIFRLREWTEQYGSVYGYLLGWRPVMVTSQPEMVRQFMVDKFEYFHGRNISPMIGDVDHTKMIHLLVAQGKRWKRLRTITTPAFSTSNLKRVMPIIDDSVRVTMGLLAEACQHDNVLNLHKFFIEMAFDVISRISMGQRESRQFRNERLELAEKCFQRFNNSPEDYVAFMFPWVGQNVLHPLMCALGRVIGHPVEVLTHIIHEAVKERKEQKVAEAANAKGGDEAEEEEGKSSKRVDFIDLFLEAEDDAVKLCNGNMAFNKTEKFERKNTCEEITTNLFLFLLAGFDTSANTLGVISHNLVMHPDVQEKMYEEIEAICGGGIDDDEPPSYEQLNQLKYMEAVVKESLRLCPIAAAIVSRVAAETTTVGEYTVEKGTVVQADVITLHRNKQIWGQDADAFRPERWTEEGGFTQPPAYYAFGGGPRICIGMRLAMVEVKTALVHLLKRFRLSKCPKTEEELNFTGQVVMNPTSLHLKVEPRLID